jgi:hypothetical protein
VVGNSRKLGVHPCFQHNVCKHVCQDSEVRRGRLGSDGESEKRPEVGGKVQGDQMGSAERVCDKYIDEGWGGVNRNHGKG